MAECSGLIERGHYAAIACREIARIKVEAHKQGIDVFTFPFKSTSDIGTIEGLVRHIRGNAYDIVNTHSGKDSWVGGIAAKLARVPVLVRTRHLNIPLRRNIFNFIHYLPDMYISCGENMRNTLVSKCGFPADKVVNISTGVSDDFFNVKRNPTLKKKYGLEADALVIAKVGIFRRVKAHQVTLKCVRRVVDELPNARFLFVGDGPDREEMEGLARKLGVAEYVIFTGFINDIAEVYSFSDLSILSSLSEGIPQSIMQAMAAGVPVVATRVGGIPEIISHMETGILVEPLDHEALAEGIIKILRNSDLAASFSEKAKEFVLKHHSMRIMLDKTESLYRSLLEKKRNENSSN
ncbi:MAG: glycosyltransferase [Nitrospirae bacterium]|nr:glycosyltransferase [Nitrospirota bacterium]